MIVVNAVSIQQIEIFLAVAGSDSISAAARALYISQPAVSESIRRMEELLGLPLFSRNNRGVNLTEHGLRLYAELDPVYQRFRIAASKIFDVPDSLSALRLNIGSLHEPYAIEAMITALKSFRERQPSVKLNSELYNPGELREKLLTEELDVTFTFSYEVESNPEIDCVQVCPLKQFFVVPTAYGLSGSDFGLLRDKTLILETSASKEPILRVCDAHGFTPARIKYAASNLLVANMVVRGEGFTIGGQQLPIKGDSYPSVSILPVSARECDEYIHLVAAWRRSDDRKILRDFVSGNTDALENRS
ncbi:MAG: LysR family transcriptional regulator [Oscillospiraceae bacterium]|nr:LysR family transcriptional regulator [Oscillospiraceae bacterium]